MIVSMKKAVVICQAEDRRRTVASLGSLGLVHLREQAIESKGLDEIQARMDRLDQAISLLRSLEAGAPDELPADHPFSELSGPGSGELLASRILELDTERRELSDERGRLQRELERWSAWGNLDPQDITDLREHGVELHLVQVPSDQEALLQDVDYLAVGRDRRELRALIVGDPGGIPVLTPPPESVPAIRAEEVNTGKRISEIRELLAQAVPLIPHLEASLAGVESLREYEAALLGFEDREHIAVHSGFVPADQVEPVRAEARKQGWALVLDDPGEDDVVPTLVRNRGPVRLIKPVFGLLGTVPGYRELDISAWFLLFFTLFFSMIIGDAGYGAVLLLLGSIAALRGLASGGVGIGTRLLLLLSVFTVGWGAITGNWFGYEPLVQNSFLSRLVIPQLYAFNPQSTETIQLLTFRIGLVHLSLAQIWNFFRDVSGKYKLRSLSQIGWFATILGLYRLVLNLVISAERYPLPQWALYAIGGGLALVVLFGTQEGRPLRDIARGFSFPNLLTTFLDAISSFADIISYIRLYAVGLASLEIARAFNAMGTQVAEGLHGIAGVIAGAAILGLGHTLNLVMGALSVVVHGVRLNMLEFSNRLGMEWTGQTYRPFAVASSEGVRE